MDNTGSDNTGSDNTGSDNTGSDNTVGPEQLREFQAFALSLARDAGALAADAFRNSRARHKADGSLVTQADEENDRLIMKTVNAAYPDHAVLSEEQNTVYDPAHPFTWVVDPIDGTTNFARGLLIWGVSIALLHRGVPIVGVVHFPLLNETYAAMAGLGATRNGEPIRSAGQTDFGSQDLIMHCTRTMRNHHIDLPLKVRSLGSAAYHMAKVADGCALVGIESEPKIWDLAAVAVIIDEAGAVMTTLAGEPIFPIPAERRDYGAEPIAALAAANGPLHRAAVDSIRPVNGGEQG